MELRLRRTQLTQTCFESALRRGALRRGTPNFIQTSAYRRVRFVKVAFLISF